MAVIRITETSGVGMSAILFSWNKWLSVSAVRAKIWQTDKHRSDKRQCYGQDPKRAVALIGNSVCRCDDYNKYISIAIGIGG